MSQTGSLVSGPQSCVPTHLGLILDGNRRWAKQNGLPTLEGHRKGYENVKHILDLANKRGIKYISAYVFSTENWNRSQEEVSYLMKLLKWVATSEVKEIHKNNGRVIWLGSRQGMDPALVRAIEKAEKLTQDNTGPTLALCLNHGGYREITEAVQRLMKSGISASEVTEDAIAKYLDYPELPPIDLVIRTSGEQRLSNFMLWRVAYSELYFTDTYWPDFSEAELDTALADYAHRQRRFGA